MSDFQITLADGEYTFARKDGKFSILHWGEAIGHIPQAITLKVVEPLFNEYERTLDSYEQLATSDEKQCSEVYYELIRTLGVPKGGSLVEKVDAMVRALEFYADVDANYFGDSPGRKLGGHYDQYEPDNGKVARKALGYDPVVRRREAWAKQRGESE